MEPAQAELRMLTFTGGGVVVLDEPPPPHPVRGRRPNKIIARQKNGRPEETNGHPNFEIPLKVTRRRKNSSGPCHAGSCRRRKFFDLDRSGQDAASSGISDVTHNMGYTVAGCRGGNCVRRVLHAGLSRWGGHRFPPPLALGNGIAGVIPSEQHTYSGTRNRKRRGL